MGLLDMYFDAAVVFVTHSSLLFKLAVAILCEKHAILLIERYSWNPKYQIMLLKLSLKADKNSLWTSVGGSRILSHCVKAKLNLFFILIFSFIKNAFINAIYLILTFNNYLKSLVANLTGKDHKNITLFMKKSKIVFRIKYLCKGVFFKRKSMK